MMMALSLWLIISGSGRHSSRPGPSPTLESFGPSHLWYHKFRLSLQGPPMPMVLWALLIERCMTWCGPLINSLIWLVIASMIQYKYINLHRHKFFNHRKIHAQSLWCAQLWDSLNKIWDPWPIVDFSNYKYNDVIFCGYCTIDDVVFIIYR